MIAAAAAPVATLLPAGPPLDLHALVRTLYPLPRSLTGDGVRQTLRELQRYIPLDVHEVKSGTVILDWQVPEEWHVRAATIRSLDGETLVDFAASNLHLVGYSAPFHGVLTREALARHIHTLPLQPDAIPYRTAYHDRGWGFCLADQTWSAMRDAAYRIDIDADLAPGSLTYGEMLIPGTGPEEVLVSVHICHPSLANDNLSGIAVAAALAQQLMREGPRRLGVRFLFLPATIGAIAWLARNETRVGAIRHGLVLTCLGDAGPFHYKSSRRGSDVDRAAAHILTHSGQAFKLLPFSPYGYDERQFCSPGFDLPVGCLMRGVHGAFPEYHTSLDDCDFVTAGALAESLRVTRDILDLLEADRIYTRVDGRGEPQLGRRGLYRAVAGQAEAGGARQMDLLWFLNLADGRHSLLDMAERAGVPFGRIAAAAGICVAKGLVTETGGQS